MSKHVVWALTTALLHVQVSSSGPSCLRASVRGTETLLSCRMLCRWESMQRGAQRGVNTNMSYCRRRSSWAPQSCHSVHRSALFVLTPLSPAAFLPSSVQPSHRLYVSSSNYAQKQILFQPLLKPWSFWKHLIYHRICNCVTKINTNLVA